MGIVARHKKLAFYGVPGESGKITYHRMTKFTSLGLSKNPKEYSREYVDEPNTESDIVGYAPSIGYAFDKHTENPVHEDIIKITDGELIGDEAARTIILVDTISGEAIKRNYAILPSSEGDNINVYTYSGDFKSKGIMTIGTAASDDDWQTITFTEKTESD